MQGIAWLLLLCSFQLPTVRGRELAGESVLMQSRGCAAALLQTAPDPSAFSALQSSGSETLADVLRARGLQIGGHPLPNLEKAITSYGIHDDRNIFLIAYYFNDGSGFLSAPLVVDLYDKNSSRWRTASIGAAQNVQNALVNTANYLGAVEGIAVAAQNIYIITHLNPSASCTLLLSHDLKLRAVLPGWYLASFQNGATVYHNSQVHFAPTHYAEISIHHAAANTDSKIYPLKPYQPIRAAHIAKVRAAYSEEWCRMHNHHCNPELFNNHLVGNVAVDDAADALAFLVAFDNKDYWSEAERSRLEAFHELRKRLAEHPLSGGISDLLFTSLYEDIALARRLKVPGCILEPFADDRELFDLFTTASAVERENGENWRAFFDKLDKRWEQPAIWNRLAQTIAVPPEYTEVVYIYRNVSNPGRMEWKELLNSEFVKSSGGMPLKDCLTREFLDRLFKKS